MDWSSSFVLVSGVRLHYLSLSQAYENPVVFIHGFTDNAACQQPLANAVADIADPVAYDIRGHGLSDASSDCAAETLAEDCKDLCEALFDTPPVLYGHSLGAEIAARAAKNMSVRGVVMEDPPAALVNEQPRDERMKRVLRDLQTWRLQPHEAIEREYSKNAPHLADTLATARKQLRPEVVNMCDWPYTDVEELVAQLDVQTLVLRPDTREVDYLDDQTTIEQSNVTVKHIDGATHTIARDAYPAVVMHLRGFIQTAFRED